MKKIYLFITSLSQGGAERQILYLGQFLNSIGYNITLVTYLDLPDHYICPNNIQRIKIAPHQSKISKIIHIWKFFLRIPTDSVVISFEERNNFLVALPFLFKSGINLIVSERNYQINNTLFINILRRIFYKRANHIVPNSHAQGSYLKHIGNGFSNKITVITNFTDTSKFHPIETNLIYPTKNNSPRKLCVFARFDEQKNYRRLVEAIRLVKNTTPYQFIVDWYGKTTDINNKPNNHYITFNRLIEQNNIEDIIHLHDAVSSVEKLMPNYTAFLLPSIFEGFSNSLSEAISCGLPCLASDVSDNRLMVQDNYNGWLFNPLDTQSIANAIIKFLEATPNDLNRLSQNSRTLAIELFNHQSFISKYLHIIDHD